MHEDAIRQLYEDRAMWYSEVKNVNKNVNRAMKSVQIFPATVGK
jgi:hypothetical protein